MDASGGGGSGDRWVFGYGSLMWRPGFAFLERPAALSMAADAPSASIRSTIAARWRGRGLVLGLAPGGSVRGAAYRVADGAVWACRSTPICASASSPPRPTSEAGSVRLAGRPPE